MERLCTNLYHLRGEIILKCIKIIMAAFIFSLSIFAFINETAVAANNRVVKNVTSSTLLVKEEKTTASKTIATLPRGTHVIVMSDDGSWAQIQYNTIKGYVASNFLQNSKATVQIASSKSGLVVKDAPSKSGKTVATLSYNMIVNKFNTEDGWSLVQYGNVLGYVSSSFIGNPNKSIQYVNASNLVVKNIASQSGINVGTLKKGDKVEVLSSLKGWSYIQNAQYAGYVVASSLTSKAPTSTVPKVVPAPTKPVTTGNQTNFANCTELRKVYPSGVSSSHPAYRSKMDRDKDGYACEK